jgi:RNA-directed DNA polymerase
MDTSATTMYDWHTLPWRKLERAVYKLQTRIYQASRRGETEAVHELQRLLIHSRSAAILAVRRVAQDNQGKRTAGIDGVASLTDPQKLALVEEIHQLPLVSKVNPVRRVWIPKPGKDEKRPLGIPVMEDRARQALAKLALEPEWEAKFEPHSFGFRPGRSCHDAVETIYRHMRIVPKYVLDADIAKCFDRINHEALLNKLGTFPNMRRAIRAWLKAGIMDGGELFPVTEGTPQGGVISPLLANIALHGLAAAVESVFQSKIYPNGRYQKPILWKPVVIRYADDFVIFHRDLDALKQAQQVAAEWLKGMGLEMKPSKTRITHTLNEIDGSAGFDFLGFHFRQYPRGKNRCRTKPNGESLGFTASIRPSPTSQKRFLEKVGEIIRSHQNAHQAGLIRLLNPVIRGWGNYFSTVVSKEIFNKMDSLIFAKLWAWALRRHPNKGKQWVARRYWLLPTRGWKFGIDGRITLHKVADIPIKRHIVVQAHRSPYDGDAIYWSTRTGAHPELPSSLARLLKVQGGCCPVCGLFFKPGDSMQAVRRFDGLMEGQRDKVVLMHEYCHDSRNAKNAMTTHHITEEPDDGKPSRPVLKTSMGSDAHA